ncbi:MAG: sensor histidine kinase [Streptosporangiales bacterium]|nr:sensor histidine kinase [Streptosporangiales bacterium]
MAAKLARLASLPPRAIDVLLAVGLATAVLLVALTASEPGAHRSTAAAYALAGVLGAVSLFRRRWPVTVLVLSVAVVTAYHAADFPAIGGSWPLSVALYTCAAAGRLWLGIAVGATAVVGGVGWRLLLEPGPVSPVLTSELQQAAAMGLVLALGDTVRSRRGWAAEVKERLRRLERDREEETRRRVVEERLRIARDLHDVMAHTVAVAGVQLNVAADALEYSLGEAKAALRTAQQVNREATAELKAAVRVLREERDESLPRSPTPDLDGVERLVEGAREAGLRVDYQKSGKAGPPPAPVGLAVYRIVQESLTNVLRHANATTVEVRIDHEPGGVAVRVVDDGQGPPPTPGDGDVGHGLIGMRERAVGPGGEFAAGSAGDRGFAVYAWIPMDATP